MGYRTNQMATRRCRHVPVEVRTVITEELVGHLCSRCLETCKPLPVPPGQTPRSVNPRRAENPPVPPHLRGTQSPRQTAEQIQNPVDSLVTRGGRHVNCTHHT